MFLKTGVVSLYIVPRQYVVCRFEFFTSMVLYFFLDILLSLLIFLLFGLPWFFHFSVSVNFSLCMCFFEH